MVHFMGILLVSRCSRSGVTSRQNVTSDLMQTKIETRFNLNIKNNFESIKLHIQYILHKFLQVKSYWYEISTSDTYERTRKRAVCVPLFKYWSPGKTLCCELQNEPQ